MAIGQKKISYLLNFAKKLPLCRVQFAKRGWVNTYYFTACEFLTLVLIGGHSLETEWLQDFQFLQSPLGTIPSVPTIIGITVTFILHSFFSS